MSFRFIEDRRDTYPVRLMCAVLEVSPAGYYAWRDRPVSEGTKSNAALLAAIRQIHQDSSGRYGSPRVHAVLRRQERGASRGRIERLMHWHGIRAIMARRRRVRTADSRHDLPIAPNLITRDFTAPAPNRVWLADITYIPTAEVAVPGGCHGSLQPQDRRLGHAGSYAGRTRIRGTDMAVNQQRLPAGLIHHSDRGVHMPRAPIATLSPEPASPHR